MKNRAGLLGFSYIITSVNMKKITTIILVILLLISASPVYALTSQDVELLIAAGLIAPDKVATARAAVSSSSNQTTTSTSNTTVAGTDKSGCLKLSTDIVEGVSGTAVASLQRFLKQQGHFNYPETTGYFGELTRKAIEDFQKRQNIVLSGTPYTTGFGAVGPSTRGTIEKLTCIDGVGTDGGDGNADGDFFGYNLDDLFNYEADFNYDAGGFEEYAFDYKADFNYGADLNYKTDFNYGSDFNYDDYGSYDAGSFLNNSIKVNLSVKDINNKFVQGSRGSKNILVATRTIEIKWESEGASGCTLRGDYPERNLPIPAKGSAQVFLVNPSYQLPPDDPSDFYAAGKALFGIRIDCQENRYLGASASDQILVHINKPNSN